MSKPKDRIKPVVSVQMIENGYIVFFQAKQVHYTKLTDALHEVSLVMRDFIEQEVKDGS